MATAASLRTKILSAAATFTIAEAKQYIAEVLATRAVDGDDRFHKRFFEEFWPLVSIAAITGDTDTLIVFNGSGHGVDGTLLFGSAKKPQMVEFTAAIDGQEEALQMEHLKRYGHAPTTAKIRATGKRNTKDRRIEDTEPEWRSGDEHRAEMLRRMGAVLKRKKQKALVRQHYVGAWLGIVIPNDPPTEFKKDRFDPVCQSLLATPKDYEPFARAFVVSTVGDFLFDSDRFKPVRSD